MRESSLSWQKNLAQGFTSARDLLHFLELPNEGSELAEQQFVSRIPLSFARRMEKKNPRDPLLLQVLAVDKELLHTKGYQTDPLQEQSNNPLKGLIHKYQGRVLLTLTGVCPVNCRYCFRRHFPYSDNNPGKVGWTAVCDYIANDSTINEVILSGGEPLLASDTVLSGLLTQLDAIEHVKTLRIHTRIPIVFPERVDASLLQVLATTRLQKVMVLHCNHAQELDSVVLDVCQRLRQINYYLLNQSVLLAGINDTPQILIALSQKLFSYGIMPYYLHVLDKVQGAAHFDVPFEQVQQLYQQMQALLPGYLVPRLVREEPGKSGKTLLL